MSEPVDWSSAGEPRSARFDDRYYSEAGPLAQARHVFLGGCGLPGAWAGQAQWRILETGFGLGLNFLATWMAWRADPARPGLLHFVSIEAYPVAAADLLRAAQAQPELAPLVQELAAQWQGLLPGFHRLAFDGGRVLLTLCVGDVQPMLRAQRFDADSLYLDGFSPQRNPDMWSPDTLKAVARLARRGTRLGTWTIARAVRDALAKQGFVLEKAPGLPPKRDCLRGVFAPAWEPRRRDPWPGEAVAAPGDCAVIGAGLAGAAVAACLARRGWRVSVLDAGAQPAAGASGAPAGVLAPHVSPDDALLSRLTRAGVQATLQQLRLLLPEGRDWAAPGVLELDARVPPAWDAQAPSLPADAAQLAQAGLAPGTAAVLHRQAGWVRPARLVAAWLATPGVSFIGGRQVARIAPHGNRWQLLDATGQVLAEADRVVLAAGAQGAALAPGLPLQPVRGQLAWGRMADAAGALPRQPLNGDGHLIAYVPDDDGALWLSGATFDRDSTDTAPRATDSSANHERLARLHPAAARALDGAFRRGAVQAWVGLRCASADRRPLVGPLAPDAPGVWACTAMGSRGLSFAALCAELLAARWHGEPLPVPLAQAQALDTRHAWAAAPGGR